MLRKIIHAVAERPLCPDKSVREHLGGARLVVRSAVRGRFTVDPVFLGARKVCSMSPLLHSE